MRMTMVPAFKHRAPTFDVEVGLAASYPGGEEDQWFDAVRQATEQFADWVKDDNMDWFEE